MPRDGAIILGAVVQPDRQGGRMSMPVPSSAPGTAALGSALLSRNSRAIIPTMGPATDAEKRYKSRRLALRIVAHSTTRVSSRRLGTVKHIRLNFIALAASKDVVVQALAVVMGFNDSKSQTVPAYWTHHFRDNRARRLLS